MRIGIVRIEAGAEGKIYSAVDRPVGVHALDQVQCALGTDDCKGNKICVNTVGSFNCVQP